MKNKITLLLFSVLFTFLGLKTSVAQTKKNPINANDVSYDVILVAGQSNTHYGYQLNKAIDTVSTRVYSLNRFDGLDYRIAPAKPVLDFWTRANDRVGFVTTFSNLYVNDILKNSKRRVLIIPCGYSGSSITSWTKNQNLYNDAMQRVNYVLKNVPGSKLTAILWHQGEANVGWADYQKTLDKMIADMRSDIDQKNIQDVPFILGGMVPYWVNAASNRRTQQEIIKSTPSRVQNTGFADSEFPTVITKPNNNFDDIHFDAAGQREMGARYYKEFLRMLNNDTKPQLLSTSKVIEPTVEKQAVLIEPAIEAQTVSIEPEITAENVMVYPNPTTDNITVSATSKIKNITIFNQSQQVVFQKKYDQNEVVIAVNHFQTGIHIVSVTLENNVTKQIKIIKK
ncbi:acetyl esterase [Flavobacterium sp. KMS]|uniref:sialate O-acetylesterase n=1 Tax=Flavobacterium sp. KMS TaxID=1566023 RepID=UPI00057FDBD5|nr:sialate O-acetylesterase [Flavobacterium sp. KMS]KIC00053.1 acetyl esterase [Flavobacterium sp. KMS]